jgi:PAS domain S-box-containing protein
MFGKPAGSHPAHGMQSMAAIGLRELLDSSPDVLFCCDALGRFQWLNSAFESLAHMRPGDALGQSFTTLLSRPHRRRATVRYSRLLRQSSVEPVTDEWTLEFADGRRLEVEARVRLSPRPDGDILFIGTLRPLDGARPRSRPAEDAAPAAGPPEAPAISESVPPAASQHTTFAGPFSGDAEPGRALSGVFPAEFEDRQTEAPAPAFAQGSRADAEAQASHDREIRELTEELHEARATAQLKTDFLAQMSHEIRTPMNGIMGMSQLLLEGDLDGDQRNLVEVIQNSARALLHLINDTLDFSKLEAGRLEVEKLDFDLRVTVNEVAALLAPLANEKRLEFDLKVHHEVPSRLRGDPGRLRQVLLNLAGNGIKFTENGRVDIGVERVTEDDDRVRLRFLVRDTGIGISPDQMKNLFQSHAQADASTARRYGGTGLGLAISRELVTLMGGAVDVKSEPGEGSTFSFEVPFDKQPIITVPPETPNVQLRGLRVLVVDPSSSVRHGLLDMLRAWGCNADEAEHAEEALPLLRRAAEHGAPYAVALIEMHQPGMDGESLGAAVRSDETLASTITMLMTSVGRRGDAQRVKDLGFSAYLLKPVEWSELYDALVEVVHNGPTREGKATPLVTRHSLAEARRGRLRILLVEDNAVNQLVTDWALRRLGYTIELAPNANQALEACERHRFDIILMDVQLPDMDGYKTVTAIRARERGGRIPIIAMTGRAVPGERERCLAAGMDDLLTKPVDLGLLCSTVEEWTRRVIEKDPVAAQRVAAERPTSGFERIGLDRPQPSAPVPGFVPATVPMNGVDAAEPVTLSASDVAGMAAEVGDAPAPSAGLPAIDDPTGPPVDAARLQEASMGIPALRDALLQTFLGDVRPRMHRLEEAVKGNDFRRTEYEAHALKGMSATIGASACEKVFEQMELLATEEKAKHIPALFDRAKAEVSRTEEHIQRLERILDKAA